MYIDAELRRRAQVSGGIDKALRELLFVPGYTQTPPSQQRAAVHQVDDDEHLRPLRSAVLEALEAFREAIT